MQEMGLHLNSFSYPERDSTSPASPLPALPWQQMPSLFFLCPTAAHSHAQTCSLHAESAGVPLPTQSLPPCPTEGPQQKSPPSLQRLFPRQHHRWTSPQKDRRMSNATCRQGVTSAIWSYSHLPFKSLTEGTLLQGDEEPERTHFPLYKYYCSALTFCSLQILCLTGNNSPPGKLLLRFCSLHSIWSEHVPTCVMCECRNCRMLRNKLFFPSAKLMTTPKMPEHFLF